MFHLSQLNRSLAQPIYDVAKADGAHRSSGVVHAKILFVKNVIQLVSLLCDQGIVFLRTVSRNIFDHFGTLQDS